MDEGVDKAVMQQAYDCRCWGDFAFLLIQRRRRCKMLGQSVWCDREAQMRRVMLHSRLVIGTWDSGSGISLGW